MKVPIIMDKYKLTKIQEIHELYAFYVYRISKKMLKDDDLAEECIQSSYEKVMRYLERIDDIDELEVKSYIYKIVRSTAIDMIRREKMCRAVSDEELFRVVDARLFYAEREKVYAERAYHELFELLERSLNENERLMIEMRYADGYNYSEIAEHFNITEAACRKRVERIKKKAVDAAVKKGLIKR